MNNTILIIANGPSILEYKLGKEIDKFDEVFMANLSPRKSPDNRDEWLSAWENFKNV